MATTNRQTVPIRQFPAGLPETLAAEVDSLGEEIMAAIAREVPAYARPLEGGFGRGVRRGVAEALHRFLTVVEAGPHCAPDLAASREVYVRLGRGEVHSGRSLDNLLSAYRVGARVSWRCLGEAAVRHGGVDAAGLVSLAEMMFAYIDGISAASAEGYAAEQFAAGGERERLLDRIGEMLLTGAPADAVAQVAETASVRLPRRLAAVLIPARLEPQPVAGREPAASVVIPPGLLPAALVPAGLVPAGLVPAGSAVPAPGRTEPFLLPTDCPRAVQGQDTWLFVGSAERGPAQAALAKRLAGLAAVVGPAVPWGQAKASAARARFARDARSAGRLAGAVATDPLFTDEHLSALVLARDPGLVTDLATRLLAPLDGLPSRTRERLAETLLHWLSLRGQRGLIAERLHIHPQTVRYRVNQLRELFGPCLEDPDVRFDLELVLRAGATGTEPAAASDDGNGSAEPARPDPGAVTRH
ncbi:helix-turn-helix domain-containing protein [Candidatus Frankia alpina]|uniref:PucR family transcriptional regulator n=1 Tax=Candidatus Frankia alpina TaxID=2699483 RepID=A0A4S5ESU3_9ACTN|nr:helix-turn-helix domain-containing protein [Candidatus Frankia alpina]THJ75202.1 PucR family transcriptional regulator [Candidatus Frankia alpina]